MGVLKRAKGKGKGRKNELEELVICERKVEEYKKRLKKLEGDYEFRKVDAGEFPPSPFFD